MITEEDMGVFGYYDLVDSYKKPTKSVQKMVTEYHKTADLPRGVNWSEADLKLCNLRWDLIEEEYTELMEEADNLENLLKEMSDLVYVIYGTAVTFGWDLDEAVRRVHKNNMERMYQDDGTIKRREDGKIIKNPNTPKVNLEDLV